MLVDLNTCVGQKFKYIGRICYRFADEKLLPLHGLMVDVIYLSPCGYYTIEYQPPPRRNHKGVIIKEYPALTYCWVDRQDLC
ncbi:MAG: hypothetical protein HC778_00145 [Chamaesiphon sp. CSU_1_12]|nr:hypothetical protein [Chamaesiphon sp. CSU_1_12]